MAACVSVVFDHLMWYHELAERELGDLNVEAKECVDYDVFLVVNFLKGQGPAPVQHDGEPFLDAIAQALAKMARFLQENPKRRPKFQALIQKVIDAYPGRPTWDEDLIRMADRHRFPPWAVECLPSLFVELSSSGDRLVTVLLWYPFKNWLDAYRDKRWRQIKSLCNGQVVEVQMKLALLVQLREIRSYFEKTRRELPFPSEGAMRGVIAKVMALLNEFARPKQHHHRPSIFNTWLLDKILSIFNRRVQLEENMVNSVFPTP